MLMGENRKKASNHTCSISQIIFIILAVTIYDYHNGFLTITVIVPDSTLGNK